MEKQRDTVLKPYYVEKSMDIMPFDAQILKTWNFLITEKTENFFQILILEIFKHDILIPGKILSENLVHNMFWCLVTPNDP